MQGQKKLSFSALALSVWTAALAESLEPGVSLRGMLLYGGLGALLLTGISAVLCVCWQQTAVRQVWLFAAVLWLLAETFRTAMQAQSVCRQEFHSMAMLGLLPLLLWVGCRIPLSGWDAPARVLWWFVLLGEGLCLAGIAGQMEWSHLLEPDAVQLARLPRVPLYAEYLLWPLLIEEPAPHRVLFLPWLTFLAQVCLAAGHLPCVRRNGLSGAGTAACMERGHLLTYGCAPASDLAYLRCFPHRLPLRSGR